MSKKDLKIYVNELTKEQLAAQIIALYDKFKPVKIYYDFVFNPNEKKRAQEARTKITQEYFPITGKKPKLRRSIAQKTVIHFISLDVDPFVVADIFLYSVEIAQIYTAEKPIKQEAFYKSMFSTTRQAVIFMQANGILEEFIPRLIHINSEAENQNWPNQIQFEHLVGRFK